MHYLRSLDFRYFHQCFLYLLKLTSNEWTMINDVACFGLIKPQISSTCHVYFEIFLESNNYGLLGTSKLFKNVSPIAPHGPMSIAPPGQRVPKKAQSRSQCPFCGKFLSNPSNLTVHMTTVHRKLRQHKCRFCGKSFGAASNKIRHEKAYCSLRFQT